ncbi:hypothetical protein N7539_002797 [Penicillium diatomitis]|uniref:RlpA-like protein double-psi beta-barrel domain-containing protein n=1 Tax=Penicillium diatomitis TaxID=2819901 RepID=A0A9X0BYZ0_9EURO|nr:uncharacterized protein N7539_002797 [Penicillium diatomitis]KAJ5491230.1 hypothetical protein N7539_002797 [Penicillium diatomitis]
MDLAHGEPVAQSTQDSWASMPKRKPIPAAAAAVEPPQTVSDQERQPEPKVELNTVQTNKPRFSAGGMAIWWASQRRSRKVLLAGIGAGLLVIALVIGLSVGLTRGKNHSNLPLPTSHGGPYSGDLTYYNPALGSCGLTNTDSDMICAVSHLLYDAASNGPNPNTNPLCGMKLRLRRNGESVDVTIVDRCVGCAATDLDVTEAVFKKVADIDQGRVKVEWSWLETPPVSVP